MQSTAQYRASLRNLRKARAAKRHHRSGESRAERSRASRLGWRHRRAAHRRFL